MRVTNNKREKKKSKWAKEKEKKKKEVIKSIMKTIEDQLNGKMKNLYTASRNAGERPKKKK